MIYLFTEKGQKEDVAVVRGRAEEDSSVEADSGVVATTQGGQICSGVAW